MSRDRKPIVPASAEDAELQRLAEAELERHAEAELERLAAKGLAPPRPDRSLADCERVIERGLETFLEVGEALLEIRDRRLYRETHETFEAYSRERWGLTRKRAYDLAAAAEVAAELSPTGDTPVPSSERVARELAPLRGEPEQMRGAWQGAVEEHGPRPTVAQVREHVEPRRQRTPDQRARAADAPAVPPELIAALAREFNFQRGAARFVHVLGGSGVGRSMWEAFRSATGATTVVCLAPAETGAAWFHELAALDDVRLLRGEFPFREGASDRLRAAAIFVFGQSQPRGVVSLWDWRSS